MSNNGLTFIGFSHWVFFVFWCLRCGLGSWLHCLTDKLEYPEMTANLLQFTDKLHHIKLYRIHIHVIELLCYNWRFTIFGWRFGLTTGDFLSTYLMHVFIVYWCFPFVCFSIEPTASHFNMYCLHFSVLSSVLYDEWRIKTVFIIYS